MSVHIIEIIKWIAGLGIVFFGLRLIIRFFLFADFLSGKTEADGKNLIQKFARLEQEKILGEKENEALADKAERIVKLFETAKNIGGTLDFENIYKIIASRLRDIYAFSRGLVVIYPDAFEEKGLSVVEFSDVREEDVRLSVPGEDNNLERIIEILKNRSERTIIRIDDVKQSLLAHQMHLASDIASFVIVPLFTADEQIGFLALSNIRSRRDPAAEYALPGDREPGDEQEKIPHIEWLSILAPQFALGLKKAMLYKRVQELSITDGLTKIYLRRFIIERLEEELGRSERFGLKLSLAMADIDHFKKINDERGHLVGDVVLQKVAALLKKNIREIDMVGKYGGEEFIVILPETDIDEAKRITQRLCDGIAEKPFQAYDEKVSVTISLGIATYPDNGKSVKDLIRQADEALYRAKADGRNRIAWAT